MCVKAKMIWQNALLAVVVSLVTMLMIFTVHMIIDPMSLNQELTKISDSMYKIFIWPYDLIENQFIGYDAIAKHRFNIVWTPVGIVLNLLYFIIMGNLIYLLTEKLTSKQKTTRKK